MELIGLTGGIGSGKSTVAGFLRELGATVIDADAAARAVVEPGSPGFQQVVQTFGERFVKAGHLDRAALGELVFADADARERLNRIVHPLVGEWMAERQREAAERGEQRVVLEIPLLYENGLEQGMAAVVVVTVPPEVQLRRLMEGPGYSEAHARDRIAAQLPLADKVRRADYVIDNSGDRESTRAQTIRAWVAITGQPSG